MTKRPLAVLAVLAGAVAPTIVLAPRNAPIAPDGVHTLDELVEHCRESGHHGWDLVDHATQVVHRKYAWYSVAHWWETPSQSFAHSRGYAHQYNLALRHVLRELGFRVRAVHSARVRLARTPWFHMGHTWLLVTVDGRTRDVCASRADNRAGDVRFVPVTPVRRFRILSFWTTTAALAPIVVVSTWRAWLTRGPLPRWMYRSFDEPAGGGDWADSADPLRPEEPPFSR